MKRNGGSVERDKAIIKTQPARAAKLALWDDYGSRLNAWPSLTPAGRQGELGGGRKSRPHESRKGAEAVVSFDGTGAIITGSYLPSGGKADVYLDGKLDRTVDVYPDEDHSKGGEAVWHAFGLKEFKAHPTACGPGGTIPRLEGQRNCAERSHRIPLNVVTLFTILTTPGMFASRRSA